MSVWYCCILLYSRKILWKLNLADWPQPLRTKILVNFNLVDSWVRSSHDLNLVLLIEGSCLLHEQYMQLQSINMRVETSSYKWGHNFFKTICNPIINKRLSCTERGMRTSLESRYVVIWASDMFNLHESPKTTPINLLRDAQWPFHAQSIGMT